MTRERSLLTPVIPMSYLQLMIKITADYGVETAALLNGTSISADSVTRPDARMTAIEWGLIAQNALRLSGCPSLGYEYGLRMQLPLHGFLGFATMTSLSGEAALNILERYFRSRQHNLRFSWHLEDDSCVIQLEELHPLGPVRHFMLEALLIGMMKGAEDLVESRDVSEFTLEFDWKEPDYHAQYTERLPRTRFQQGRNAIRFPKKFLQLSPRLSDALASQQAIERCEEELALAGSMDADIVTRVRRALNGPHGTYPSQDEVAKRLCLSTRSLARKLRDEGMSFSELVKEEKQREAMSLLKNSGLKLEEIAARLGYINPANFTRAFRLWTGQTPSEFRRRNATNTSSPVNNGKTRS